MLKTSDIISKPIFTLYEGLCIGTVYDFSFDLKRKKINGFYFFDDESQVNQFFLSYRNIFSISENAIMVKNTTYVSHSDINKMNIINKIMYSLAGEYLGKIIDIYFDENYNVISFCSDQNVIIPIENLVSVVHDIVIFNLSNKKIIISKFKPKNIFKTNDLENINVKILDVNKLSAPPIISDNFNDKNFENKNIINGNLNFNLNKKESNVILPKKILINPKNIIGKIANKTVYGLNGEIIVKDTQLITEKIYQKAKRHAKLFELSNSV